MHNLWVFIFFFKNTFCCKLFSDCCDKFDYPGSIVYLSCFDFFVQKSFLTKNCVLTAEMNLTTRGPLYTCRVMIKISRISILTPN